MATHATERHVPMARRAAAPNLREVALSEKHKPPQPCQACQGHGNANKRCRRSPQVSQTHKRKLNFCFQNASGSYATWACNLAALLCTTTHNNQLELDATTAIPVQDMLRHAVDPLFRVKLYTWCNRPPIAWTIAVAALHAPCRPRQASIHQNFHNAITTQPQLRTTSSLPPHNTNNRPAHIKTRFREATGNYQVGWGWVMFRSIPSRRSVRPSRRSSPKSLRQMACWHAFGLRPRKNSGHSCLHEYLS